MAWFRRRQERKATLRAARMLLALEDLAAARTKPKRVARASLSAPR